MTRTAALAMAVIDGVSAARRVMTVFLVKHVLASTTDVRSMVKVYIPTRNTR